METIKNSLNQRVGFYLKSTRVEIGPRGTVQVSGKDIDASPQLQEMLKCGYLRRLGGAAKAKGAEEGATVRKTK